MCLQLPDFRAYGRLLKAKELDVDKVEHFRLKDFIIPNCAVLVGAIPGVYTYVEALVYSLDAQDCVIVYCDTIEQAEDAYLDMQHLISVRGRPGDSKMRKNARESVLRKALNKLPHERDRQNALAALRLPYTNALDDLPELESPPVESAGTDAPPSLLSACSSDEEIGDGEASHRTPGPGASGWRTSGAFASMGKGKLPVSLPPSLLSSPVSTTAALPAAATNVGRSSPTKSVPRKGKVSRSPPGDLARYAVILREGNIMLILPSYDLGSTMQSPFRHKADWEDHHKVLRIPLQIHPNWVPPTPVTPPYGVPKTWVPDGAVARSVSRDAGFGSHNAEWQIVCEGNQPGIYASRKSAVDMNTGIKPALVVFVNEEFASVESAVGRWFELLAAQQLKTVTLIKHPYPA